MKKRFILLIFITLCLYIVIAYTEYPTSYKRSYIVDDEMKAEMKKHGTDILYEDWNGNIYFMRKGEKIYVRRAK